MTGATADAILTVAVAEHLRRASSGLGGIQHRGLLDALMCLPTGADVPVADLGPVVLDHLRAAPGGCVEWTDRATRARRLVEPVVTVDLVLVRAAGWRSGLRRAQPFAPFASRVVLLERPPGRLAEMAWEADASGVGMWARQVDGRIAEVVAPEPFVRRFVKPASWRFAETAYAAWLNATTR